MAKRKKGTLHPRFAMYGGKTSRHHRKCRSNGGDNLPNNIVIVPAHLHEHYHALFGNMKATEIAEYLSDVWIDKQWKLVAHFIGGIEVHKNSFS